MDMAMLQETHGNLVEVEGEGAARDRARLPCLGVGV